MGFAFDLSWKFSFVRCQRFIADALEKARLDNSRDTLHFRMSRSEFEIWNIRVWNEIYNCNLEDITLGSEWIMQSKEMNANYI